MNTKTATPAQIDAEIARINGLIQRANSAAEAAQRMMERRPDMPKAARAIYTRDVEAALDQIDELREEAAPLHAAYAAQRWSRFYLVPGGHIHADTNCSTCNNGRNLTKFGWLTDLSGKTEEEAVAEHGALLCTVCFPSAPVHWTNALELAAEARKNSQCSGSGSYLNRDLPHREGFYTGNWGTCETCGERATLTKTNKLRTHKAK